MAVDARKRAVAHAEDDSEPDVDEEDEESEEEIIDAEDEEEEDVEAAGRAEEGWQGADDDEEEEEEEEEEKDPEDDGADIGDEAEDEEEEEEDMEIDAEDEEEEAVEPAGRVKAGADEDEDDEDEEEEEEGEEEEEAAHPKRKGKNTDDANDADGGWKGLSTAFTNIMGRELAAPQAPVLSETPIEKNLRTQKAEYKEKRALALKEKSLMDAGHTLPSFADKTFELELRRVATKGVVRLFNTIKEFQRKGDDDVEDTKDNTKNMPMKRRQEEMAEAKQETFAKMWGNKDKQNPRAKRRREAAAAKGGGEGLDPMAEFG